MTIGWLALLIEMLFLALFKGFIRDFEVVTVYLIGINFIFVMLGIIKYKKGFRELFYSAYLLRLGIMFWDIYARGIYFLPHSGGDSEGFYRSAYLISNNIELLKYPIYGDLYSKLLGILFYITSPERLLGQYINVLLGLTVIIIVYRTLTLLEVNKKILMRSVALISFFPHAIIFSGILLRENFISVFVALSFYFFIKWYKNGNNGNIVSSFLSLAIASAFHSGVIGIAVGYAFMYMFYKHKSKSLKFSVKTIVYFIAFVMLGILVFTQFSDLLLSKFARVGEITDVYYITNLRGGGSAYLTGLKINSLWQLIIFAPIKMFYFLISPLPMDWRGINDIIAFFLDSLIYMYLIVNCYFNLRKTKIKTPIIIGTLISLISVIFIFGIGISNAGTALRHRNKIFSIIVILNAILDTKKKDIHLQSYNKI